jgi:hypothetical protein
MSLNMINLISMEGIPMKTSKGAFARPRNQMVRVGAIAGIVAVVGLFSGAFVSTAAAEGPGENIAEAFKDGEFDVNFRYRYEFVDRDTPRPGLAADPVTKNANASTIRTRLVYKTAEWRKLFATVNMDDVRTVFVNDYNSTRNGQTQYAAVADPAGTDLNLASLTYTGLEDGKVVLGRQRIIRDNARFVGNVGWRQNEQTYDSISIDYGFLDKGEVFYGYVDRVKRIFGPDDGTPAGSWQSNSHLFDARYAFTPLLKLSGYAYLLDFKNGAAFSSQTLGLRLAGKTDSDGGLDISYLVSYAQQQDYGDNPNNYDQGYYVAEFGLDWENYGLKGGYEVLEGSGVTGESFQTPLATLHAFNGLADQFLVTPGGGLQDAYIKGTAKAKWGKFSLVYHDFSEQTGSADYGTELDFIANWSFLKHYKVLAGFGIFSADQNTPIAVHSDITKGWVMLTASF